MVHKVSIFGLKKYLASDESSIAVRKKKSGAIDLKAGNSESENTC